MASNDSPRETLAGTSTNVTEEETVLNEPKFKYERILADVTKLFEMDCASCFYIHDKFIAIGCNSGRVCLFDHLGNAHMESTARHHKCAVTCISVDALGSYFISCANDSTISIFGIGSDEYNQRIELRTAAKSVVISEDFSRQGSGQRFVTAERSLTLHERGFLGRKETVLYQGLDRDGMIATTSWKNAYIAFTNETGTRIYDTKLTRTVTLIQPVHKTEKYYSSKFPPKHCWMDDSTLAVGWANTVCVCTITTKSEDRSKLPYKRGEIICRWVLPDLFVAGLSWSSADNARGWKEIVIFGIQVTDDKEMEGLDETKSSVSHMSTATTVTTAFEVDAGQQTTACMLIVRPESVDCFELASEDTIEMRHASIKHLKRFHLGALPHDSLYFMLGTKELIQAQPCSADDRVYWFLENEHYVEAMECAMKHRDSLLTTSVLEVGKQLIDHLIAENDFETAASYLPQVCGRHKEEWEHYVNEFENHRQILKVVPVIPTKSPQLEPECYESVLIAALYNHRNLFRKLILEWNPDIYRAASIIDKAVHLMAEDHQKRKTSPLGDTEAHSSLSREDLISIYKALAHLYAYTRNFNRAIEVSLLLKDPTVFRVIDRYRLFDLVKDRILELMEINSDLAIRLLLDNEDSMPSKQVVSQLSRQPRLQIAYLNRLLSRGEGFEHSDLLVRLYAENDRSKLLSFLRKSETYKLDLALEICKRKKFTDEVVFLLGRSGNRLEALDVIMKQMGRIEAAIEFCSESTDDVELWERLVELAVTKADHVTKLLSTAGTFIDPLNVIQKLSPEMDIPGIRKALLKIVKDYELQINLLDESKAVTANDVVELFEQLARHPLQGTSIDAHDCCCLCRLSVIYDARSTSSSSEIRIFSCGHVFHKKCMENRTTLKRPSALAEADLLQRISILAENGACLCPLCFDRYSDELQEAQTAAKAINVPETPVIKETNPFLQSQ